MRNKKILSIFADGEDAKSNHNENLNNHPLFKTSVPTDRCELAELKQLDIIGFNSSAEKQFCELICYLLADGDLSPREAIQEASFELNISPETSKRYLTKHTARRANFRVDENGLLRCKKHQH
jgi:hypothetical protein